MVPVLSGSECTVGRLGGIGEERRAGESPEHSSNMGHFVLRETLLLSIHALISWRISILVLPKPKHAVIMNIPAGSRVMCVMAGLIVHTPSCTHYITSLTPVDLRLHICGEWRVHMDVYRFNAAYETQNTHGNVDSSECM